MFRMPTEPTSACNYLPCKYCYGFYLVTTLYKHTGTCLLNPGTTRESAVRSGRMIIAQLLPKSTLSAEIQELLRGMKETKENPGEKSSTKFKPQFLGCSDTNSLHLDDYPYSKIQPSAFHN